MYRRTRLTPDPFPSPTDVRPRPLPSPTKRHSAISARSALTTDTPSTPPRTPSPFTTTTAVPHTNGNGDHELPTIQVNLDGAGADASSEDPIAKSSERTRTWAEEVERQRQRTERKEKSKPRKPRPKQLRLERRGDKSSNVIDSLVKVLDPDDDFRDPLPTAASVISNLSRKSVHLASDTDDDDDEGGKNSEVWRYRRDRKKSLTKTSTTASTSYSGKGTSTKGKDKVPPLPTQPFPTLGRPILSIQQAQSPIKTTSHSRITPATPPVPRPHMSPPSRQSPSPTTSPSFPPTRPTSPAKKVAILSIDDIVKRHATAMADAESAARENARKDLGLLPLPSPTSTTPTSITPTSPAEARTSTSPVALGPLVSPLSQLSPRPPSSLSAPPVSPLMSDSADAARYRRRNNTPPAIYTSTRASTSPSYTLESRPRPTPRLGSEHASAGGGDESSNGDTVVGMMMGQVLLDHLERGILPSSPDPSALRFPTGPSGPNRRTSFDPAPPLPSRHPSTSPISTNFKRISLPVTPTEEEESHAMAVYLRSPRLNRSVHLPRPFPERPLRVSFAEVGSPTGTPVVIFLGLGCVRYLIALYDDLATALKLRLICIDRWGMGKTDNTPQERRGPLEWSLVVEKVLAEIGVQDFRIIAHSAGCPYAAAVALRLEERVKGRIHFLAPWVGSEVDGGFKWLKWVPNGVIKSAVAAEWKFQSFRLGKPPPLVHKPISHIAESPGRPSLDRSKSEMVHPHNSPYLARSPDLRRSSQVLFIDPPSASTASLATTPVKTSRLRNLKSLTPLRSRSDNGPVKSSASSIKSTSTSPSKSVHPQSVNGVGLVEGFDPFTSGLHDTLPITPLSSTTPDQPAVGPALTTALLQASHAECEPGTTNDLLAIILNRPHRPWGFDYTDLNNPVKIWWGSEDERISEKSVRWMERSMVKGGAEVKIVLGEGHNLMTCATVMCEVFESMSKEARDRRY